VANPIPLTRRSLASLGIVAALVLGACGSDGESAESTTTTTTTSAETTTTSTTRPTTTTTEAADSTVYAATAKDDSIDVYENRDDDEPSRTVTAERAVSVPGATPITFLVDEVADDRLRVYLPVRPNGARGWIDRDEVDVSPVRHRVEVVLSEFRLRVYEDDVVVLDEPIGVGRQDRPTPGGVYYIKELLRPPDPEGFYGTYAYGLSGFSPVLDSFAGGEAVIGIHGTNEPELIGQEVSSGCIRLHNDAIDRMAEEIGLPLGTPVEIEA
jgi:lipoprotein-anchoring transpeptidase ErfK/SrfK